MDAYEDIEKDKKRQEYNPLSKMVCEKEGDFETFAKSDFRVVKFCIGLAAPDLPFCIVFG